MTIYSQKKLKCKANATRSGSQVYDGASKLRTEVGNRGAPESLELQRKLKYKANPTRAKMEVSGNQSSIANTRKKLEVSGTGSQPSIKKPQMSDDIAKKLRSEVEKRASLHDPALWNSVDDKVLRAALLTERFAETIFKAKHEIQKSDNKTIQRDKEKLERKKRRQEQARMDAARKRESDRVAARMAMQSMKKTVDIDDAMDIMKEFEEILRRDSCTKFEENIEVG